MKMWYHKRFDMYVPKNPWWGNKWDEELVEIEIKKEELVVMGGDDDPYNHAGRWEFTWFEERFEHNMLNKIPWPYGKYKIIIEPIEDE